MRRPRFLGRRRSEPSLEQHRDYVGGAWEEIGRLQFEFIVAQGLRPDQVFLDIACGSLRGGVHFIRYLDRRNYLGLDKERTLIERGVSLELGHALFEEKQPEFVVDDRFGFSRFSRRPDVSLAQSLFTHLQPDAIALCVTNLRAVVAPGHRFFASFFEGPSDANPDRSHDHARFQYTRDELEALAGRHGWAATYVGDWNHPRDQKMIVFVAETQ